MKTAWCHPVVQSFNAWHAQLLAFVCVNTTATTTMTIIKNGHTMTESHHHKFYYCTGLFDEQTIIIKESEIVQRIFLKYSRTLEFRCRWIEMQAGSHTNSLFFSENAVEKKLLTFFPISSSLKSELKYLFPLLKIFQPKNFFNTFIIFISI